MTMVEYPRALLEAAGPPDRWEMNRIGESGARVFFLPERGAWLKCAPSGVEAEARVLGYLQGRARVPRVLLYHEEGGLQYLVTESLPGCSLIDPSVLACPEKLVRVLASALRELHGLEIGDCPLDQRLVVKLGTWEFPPDERAWLVANAPEEDLVFTHGDACLPNFHCEDGGFSGCIDLGDAGVADRWQDLALGLWSLQYNLGTKDWGRRFLEEYGVEVDERRVEYFLRLNGMGRAEVV